MTRLFLFQIGPVQSFIAAARRPQDLYVGSRLLSSIAGSGVLAAHQAGADLLFPALGSRGELPEGVPHRFAFISDEVPRDLAEYIEGEMRKQWWAHASKVKDWLLDKVRGGAWEATFDQQVASWLESTWVAVPYGSDHGASYAAANGAMAARRQARAFPQVYEPGKKCTLTGSQTALPLDWEHLRGRVGEAALRPNEALGSLATIKRFAQMARVDIGARRTFPDLATIAERPDDAPADQPSFVAILHMDGDKMGSRIAAMRSLEEHRQLSRSLTIFAEQRVPQIIAQYAPAELVYAGGDDVLALLPLRYALRCADDLRLAFDETVGGQMSGGIAITPYDLPLDQALDDARAAEHRAKHVYDRNALVVRETHGSGAMREAGIKWNELKYIYRLQVMFATDALSGKLGYDLLQVARDLAPDALVGLPDSSGNRMIVENFIPAEMRCAELGRLAARRTAEGAAPEVKAAVRQLAKRMAVIGEGQGGYETLAHWAILARFLAKGQPA